VTTGWGHDLPALRFDDDGALRGVGDCATGRCLQRLDAFARESGRDEIAAWGRWAAGTLSLLEAGHASATLTVAANHGVHYLVGVPTVTPPSSGTFSYSLTAATAPTMTPLGYAPGTFDGAAVVRFGGGAARVGLTGRVDIADSRFEFETRGGTTSPGDSQLTLNEHHGFSGTLESTGGASLPWLCGGGACRVEVRGGLLGPEGEGLGLGYTIRSDSGSTTIDGVSVFRRP
jgi:hypothetical protein